MIRLFDLRIMTASELQEIENGNGYISYLEKQIEILEKRGLNHFKKMMKLEKENIQLKNMLDRKITQEIGNLKEVKKNENTL